MYVAISQVVCKLFIANESESMPTETDPYPDGDKWYAEVGVLDNIELTYSIYYDVRFVQDPKMRVKR